VDESKTWYMCVATGQAGMARSGWHLAERNAASEAMAIAELCEEMGDCMTIEFSGDDPPKLGLTYATEPEMCEDIMADLRDDDVDDSEDDFDDNFEPGEWGLYGYS